MFKVEQLDLSAKPAWQRLFSFFTLFALCWLPLWAGLQLSIRSSVVRETASVAGLYLSILIALTLWPRLTKVQETGPFHAYGLYLDRQGALEYCIGLLVGMVLLGQFYLMVWSLGLVRFQIAFPPLNLLLQGLLVGLALALIEELLFRGLLLQELQKGYGRACGVLCSSLVFALLHYIRPPEKALALLPAMPGIFLFGILLALVKGWRSGRLAVCIGIHSVVICFLVISERVPFLIHEDAAPKWLVGNPWQPVSGLIGWWSILAWIALVLFLKNRLSPAA